MLNRYPPWKYFLLLGILLLALIYAAPNLFGEDPAVQISAKAGRLKHVMLLIAKGANINSSDVNGLTPLHYAAKGGFNDLVKLLLGCGANAEAKTEDNELPIDLVPKKNDSTKKIFRDFATSKTNLKEGDSLIHLAVIRKDLLTLRLLGEKEGVNKRNSKGETPLDYARRLGNQEMIRCLFRLGGRRFKEVRAETII